MLAPTSWLSFIRAIVRACALALLSQAAVHAQSPVVFMTWEDPSTYTSLYRFDHGIETFAVEGDEDDDAFLGITIANGEVLIGNYLGDRIERYSLSGTHLGEFGNVGGSASFMESDAAGNVYTTLFDFDLPTPVGGRRLNAGGIVTGSFSATRGIDADAVGNVYTVNNGSLVKYAPNGSILNSQAVGSDAWDIAIDEQGSRLFLTDQSSLVRIYDIAGPSPVLSGSLPAVANANITGVFFDDATGNVLVTDFGVFSNDQRGIEFAPNGTILREYRTGVISGIAWDIAAYVPEPSTAILFPLGSLGIGLIRGRAQR